MEILIGKALAVAVTLLVVGFLIREGVRMFATLDDKIDVDMGISPRWIIVCATLTGLCWLGAAAELVVWLWTIV